MLITYLFPRLYNGFPESIIKTVGTKNQSAAELIGFSIDS